MRNLFITAFMLLGCFQLFGQESRKEVSVGFRVGYAVLDTGYADNGTRLADLVQYLERVMTDDQLELVEVSFCGSASPEGSFAANRSLAERRRMALERYVRERVLLPDSIVTYPNEGFIAWNRLAELVEQSDMPYKEEAVDVLRNEPEFTYNDKGVLVDSRKKHLMELRWGRSWNYMYRHFFSDLRNASMVLVTVRPKPMEPVAEVPEEKVPAEVPAVVQPVDSVAQLPVEEKKPFYMAVKSNLLYDVQAVPNVGVEFYLGDNWSVVGQWMYGWWSKNSSHRYWRIYGGDLAIRKWFGKEAEEKPLTGHHLGIYGQAFTYDFEWHGKGYMGGRPGGTLWDKLNYAAGVEYGYSLPIARRLNLDFTIGLGYWGGQYYEYIPLDGHYVWQATKNRHWFGPTKAEVSLMWLLGRGNSNMKKGGTK